MSEEQEYINEEAERRQAIEEIPTEERILAAAEKEFLSKGFAAARTTAIAEAAGVNHAMLHYYFRTKEKLFDRVISDKLSDLAQTVIINIDNDKPLAIAIRQAVGNHFDYVRAHPELPRFIVSEVFPNPELVERLRAKWQSIAISMASALQTRLDACAEKGECRRVSAVSLVLDIVSLNVLPMLALPIMSSMSESIMHMSPDRFLDIRREENIRTILKKLEP